MSMNFIDMPPDEEAEAAADAESPPMSIPPMSPMSWPCMPLELEPALSPMSIPPMPCLSSAKTSSGVPVTPSTQSSRRTTHSSSYASVSLGSSTISGAYRPRSSWTPTCGWKKYVPGASARKRYVKVDPARTAVWVAGGTPSMSLRSAMPCQWIDVVVLFGSWLDSSATRVSPTESRTSPPGVRPSKAQVLGMTPPPRSIMAGAAVRVTFRWCPVLLRFFSVAATAEASGLIRAVPLPEPLAWVQAASAPAPAAPSPASRTERRLVLFIVWVSSVS